MKNLKNIAMLIDADNTQLSKLESVIQEISANGRIVVKACVRQLAQRFP